MEKEKGKNKRNFRMKIRDVGGMETVGTVMLGHRIEVVSRLLDRAT